MRLVCQLTNVPDTVGSMLRGVLTAHPCQSKSGRLREAQNFRHAFPTWDRWMEMNG